jgi:hypothetical protein
MTITIRPRWSLGRGKTLVPSRWQATREHPAVPDPCRNGRVARLRKSRRSQHDENSPGGGEPSRG